MDPNLEFILEWNSEFPLDRLWRKKYDVPFNSKSHRSISPQDMLLDFIEDSLYKKVVSEMEKESDQNKYIPGNLDFLIPQKESDLDFENIDLNNFKL